MTDQQTEIRMGDVRGNDSYGVGGLPRQRTRQLVGPIIQLSHGLPDLFFRFFTQISSVVDDSRNSRNGNPRFLCYIF